jgi:hypothetical protein
MSNKQSIGKVIIAEAGNNDTGSLNSAFINALHHADIIIVDADCPIILIQEYRKNKIVKFVTTTVDSYGNMEYEGSGLLVEHALKGESVIRLVGDDMFLGSFSAELRVLLDHHIPVEIIPALALEPVIVEGENIPAVRKNINGRYRNKRGTNGSDARNVPSKYNGKSQWWEKDYLLNEIRWKRIATYSLVVFALMLIGHFIFSYIPLKEMASDASVFYQTLDPNFEWMVLAGFLAQMVDGATSMGYGVTSAIVLMNANVNPAVISGSIHTAEMFTSGASGYSHYRFGNVNKKLFRALLIPGVIGAVLGAILLVKFGETHISYIRPLMAAYTFFLGIRIFSNAFRNMQVKKKFKRYGWLAGTGGFLDSFGGGGWGPIVTSTLITKGRTPKYVVGSVSLTEFFVTLASAFTFFTLIGVQHWQVIIALVIGGVLAEPIAAKLAGKLPRKTSFLLLGAVVMIWSIRILLRYL